MTAPEIYITKFDLQRLDNFFTGHGFESEKDRENARALYQELHRGILVDSRDVPPNVVTMNSKIKLRDLVSNKLMTYTLVFPTDANIDEGKISVLSPVGMAILGYSVGDTIEWKVPKGTRQLYIEEIVYQPEAMGHYHL
jgi:regulator of nucleoside diphosphate kinase